MTIHELKGRAKWIVYGLAITVVIVSGFYLVMGEDHAIGGDSLQGEILHSNYVLPGHAALDGH
ncbi:hypothetical protein HOG48_03725 [Candidatus Peregrinibacteria bacterium]|jgi:hypothetical protein|nr:hypothetical protein [Candidatus Peregrinibacteria bacterium]